MPDPRSSAEGCSRRRRAATTRRSGVACRGVGGGSCGDPARPGPQQLQGRSTMTKVGIILGSTRPGRVGAGVARWVLENALTRSDAEFELVDLADFPLPHLDEVMPPMMGQYQNE